MSTVFEECNTEEQRSILRFLWAKGLNVKSIHIEIFPVYCGKGLSREAVQSLAEKFSQGRSKISDDETEVRN
jgi:hypothetical protein